MEFFGYLRQDGLAGARNHVGIISNGVCTADAANRIAREVNGCVAFTHRENCQLISPDKEIVYRTLINLGKNPNLAAVLVVSAGCSDPCLDPLVIAEGIAEPKKPVEVCSIHQVGGLLTALSKGAHQARQMAADASRIKRQALPISMLCLGVECGGSTPLSGPVTNAAQGAALDRIINAGGSGGFGETPEVIGAEQLIAARAVNSEVEQSMLKVVRDYETTLKNSGFNFFGANPDPQNIEDGLSSIEEKAVGAVRKGGTTPLTEVIGFGERTRGQGLFFVDTPGSDLISLAGLAAAGCNVITYSTECAVPYGFPCVPVIKLTANRIHYQKFPDILDYLVDIDTAIFNLGEEGEALFNLIVEVASGRRTQNEIIGYTGTCDLWTTAPKA